MKYDLMKLITEIRKTLISFLIKRTKKSRQECGIKFFVHTFLTENVRQLLNISFSFSLNMHRLDSKISFDFNLKQLFHPTQPRKGFHMAHKIYGYFGRVAISNLAHSDGNMIIHSMIMENVKFNFPYQIFSMLALLCCCSDLHNEVIISELTIKLHNSED